MAGGFRGSRWLCLACAGAALAISLAASAAQAATYTRLASFNGANGEFPLGSLVSDSAGNLYGTTEQGGVEDYGVLFKFNPNSGAITALVTFNGPNGGFPEGSLIADTSGNLYGTTAEGGANDYGTLFKLNLGTGVLTTLVSFGDGNGLIPRSSLMADASGNLYGTTQAGAIDHGTVFKFNTNTGVLTTLAWFNGANGGNPRAGVIVDAAGKLYGVTERGGSNDTGTVFKLDPVTGVLTTLVEFTGANGSRPRGDIVADAAGNLYGTTERGGTNDFGTVFQIDPATGNLTTLVSFNGVNGRQPRGGLIADATGALYGTTERGGINGYGTVFKVDSLTRELTTLTSMAFTIGEYSRAGLVADAAGNLYGTTRQGGTGSSGTIFKLTDTGFVVNSTPNPPGDFNSDGVVDAADYTVWRDTGGTPAQYDVWRTNYGEVAGNATAPSPSEAVPEPAGVASLVMGAAAVVRVRRRRLIG